MVLHTSLVCSFLRRCILLGSLELVLYSNSTQDAVEYDIVSVKLT